MGAFGDVDSIRLVARAQVQIAVRDVAGRHARSLFGEMRPEGRSVTWDARCDDGRWSRGVYLVELNGGGWRRTMRSWGSDRCVGTVTRARDRSAASCAGRGFSVIQNRHASIVTTQRREANRKRCRLTARRPGR